MKTVSFVLMMLLTIVVFLPFSSAIVKIKVDPLTSTFLNLFDTPSSYSGEGGNCVVVNVGEDGLEFGSCGGGGGGGSGDSGVVMGSFIILNSICS